MRLSSLSVENKMLGENALTAKNAETTKKTTPIQLWLAMRSLLCGRMSSLLRLLCFFAANSPLL